MIIAWWLSLLFVLSVWIFYPCALYLLSLLKIQSIPRETSSQSCISIIIAAHNEADNLENRIHNIYSSTYPLSLIEVVIASDGSTDETPRVVERLRTKYTDLKFIDISPQGGRSNAHNIAVSYCKGEILIFTDAETIFESDFLRNILACFERKEVGFASGVLKYRNLDSTAVTQSAGLYWRFEYLLRNLESKLGIYAFGSGACCAVRKIFYKDISPVGDVDFTTPLDVVLQGGKCMHTSDAIAYEDMPDSIDREFRARVRMTAKNIYGTIEKWGISGVLKHPIYSLVILFHKIGRWITPFALMALLISNIFLLKEHFFYSVIFSAQLFFYLAALSGYLGLNAPFAKASFSFCLANAGFLVGVLRALTGRVPRLYKPMSQTHR